MSGWARSAKDALRNVVHRSGSSLGERRGNHAVDVAADLVRPFLAAYDRSLDPYDIATNGERLLLERLGPHLDTVFDVGANVGEWTAVALTAGAREVHAFEIVTPTAATLRSRVSGEDRVIVNEVGLGAESGMVELLYYPDDPTLSSTATELPHDLPHETVQARVTTGDEHCRSNGIDRISLLKIDVEGEESSVLQGFSSMLSDRRIDAIQFEYGVAAVLKRFLVIDFYELFESVGYRVGPLTPGGVAFQDYSLVLERFRHVNYVAVRKDREDLIDQTSLR